MRLIILAGDISMTQTIDVNNLAEGKTIGEVEPQTPLHTSTFPVVKPKKNPASETGLISAIDLNSEGLEDANSQDASRTTDESKPVETLTAQPDAATQLVNANAHKPLVLIVEDTQELAEVIEATLQRMGLRTAHESHGARALQSFYELDPDLVLLDISLPDTTGWKIIDAIKERLEETQGEMPKVIVITAFDDPANRLIGKLQDVHSYLIKPFTSDQIENLVKQALGSGASS
ncbi:MAG: hypothetical protein CUN56_11375 [Phototrophicales bacterium]|nr:MAG: hypothetical protein CUN56_11375 [Phototrophicales bacterium]RMG75977.1 MAG: response regulator [Chloroflexota bacterium]